ncbi:MAG: 50S ribosomal protein L19 [Candidatus Pacebacteria bacterium GW2011_GWF2_38_9]|nr:MAG: 50S ribosomal protein L19, large subunit ribosomal protein L19 [candidate division TM6 bacterium GW2011_GWF2_28_16]KKQ88954.1 MAG: 50S ribosomal protein L19 [Candidatus Pacebacteria bacterium GW2011_GWF2_38_9]MBU1033911.1 50S ribosomal protein L19 [Patescibacteria group bacterium]HAZ73129.1 50S ribosomal protein L19 [Candidatus Paceibacterota bacterium]
MAQNFIYNDQEVNVGDTVRVHQEISEGKKTRVQVFEGLVIAVKNREVNKTFTVRKIATNNVGVEKIFPIMMPSIKKIEVKRRGDVKRSKLYYLRDKVGKAASRVKEKSLFTETKKTA